MTTTEKARERAKEIINKLQRLGNFEEFSDSRESDGLHEGSLLIIASVLLAVRKETLEEAQKKIDALKVNRDTKVRMLGLGYLAACNDAIQAIRKLEE